ncbi:MAG: hypothetical protein MO852_01450 [Candidatus Devosia euplotis]|nr:hypothetical protein [Candidatus Devosia euplotis]
MSTIVIVVMIASLVSALIFMPIIGAFIASSHLDEKKKEAADVVMYTDKFDPPKGTGLDWPLRAGDGTSDAPASHHAGGWLRHRSPDV